MGDMGDFYRDLRETRSAFKRQRSEAQAPFIGWLMYIAKRWVPLPGGIRILLEVERNGGFFVEMFDYWPSSGKWFDVRLRQHRQGERALRTRLNEVRGYYD